MSTKYLGKTFDIHGGGNDLKFPHHENEVAQNHGACGCDPANYWLHTNMLLMNGAKMSKSVGNTITPDELINGDSHLISKGYSPMVIRFFNLQAHYSSPLDLTDEGLQAAEKGYRRLMEANKTLQVFAHPGGGTDGALNGEIAKLIAETEEEMNDDFNTPKALAKLFELASKINGLKDGHLDWAQLEEATLADLKKLYHAYIFDIFGLKEEGDGGGDNGVLAGVMDLVIDLRQNARANKAVSYTHLTLPTTPYV